MVEPGFLPVKSIPTFDLRPILLKGGISIVPDVLSNTRIISFSSDNGDNEIYIQKYCVSCNVFRPIKTSHCSDCGLCVIEKDHHCIWVNNCVGRNNYRFFIGFIYSLFVLTSYASYSFDLLENTILSNHLYNVINRVLFVLAFAFGLFCVYHTFLWIFNISSRTFLNLRGRVSLSISVKDLLYRIATIKPIILQHRNTI